MNKNEHVETPAPLLTREQTARLLGMTRNGLDQLTYRGGGPPFLKIGRAIRYAVSDIREFIERRKVTGRTA